MNSFRKKFLSFILFTLIASSSYLLFIRAVTDPKASPEKIDDSLVRIYENFLHKTKYSYESILESGTNYDNQERVFVELTKKMKELNTSTGPDYEKLRAQLLEEIRKNESSFKSFYLKVAKIKPEELKKQIEERNKQFDIILEGN